MITSHFLGDQFFRLDIGKEDGKASNLRNWSPKKFSRWFCSIQSKFQEPRKDIGHLGIEDPKSWQVNEVALFSEKWNCW